MSHCRKQMISLYTYLFFILLRSILNPFKFSLTNFATSGSTAFQIFALFWKAVSISELNESKVLAFTYASASSRDGSRTAAISKMERFVIIVNGFQSLTIIAKRSILDVEAALDPFLSSNKTFLECIFK